MTSLLSCVVAAAFLGGDPGLQGLPFGIPPTADDAVITSVAPPQCLFYLNWAGTASPDAASKCETEKLLAEPEVQAFLGGISKAFADGLRKAKESAKQSAAAVPEVPPPGVSPEATPTATANPPEPPRANHVRIVERASDVVAPAAALAATPAESQSPIWDSASCYDFCSVILTHPAAIFVREMKLSSGEPTADATAKASAPAPLPSRESDPQEVHAGAVVNLGADSDRLRAEFAKYIAEGKKAGVEGFLEEVKIRGETWYRTKPILPGTKNLITFGFHGTYLVIGVGPGEVENILARWNKPAPAWLTKAMEQTVVSRRTGIVYLNIKMLREKLLLSAVADSAAKNSATANATTTALLTYAGLDNVDSLVSTTGLDDYGIINRLLVAMDGKPHGLLDLVADRPLAAADLAPIPSNALMAFAARVDLARSTDVLFAAYERALPASDTESRKKLDEFKKDYAVRLRAFFKALGDTWCVYNSPTEGEVAFMGWTAVAPVRNRALLVAGLEQLMARQDSKDDKERAEFDQTLQSLCTGATGPIRIKKCKFAGREIYYISGQAIAPALAITDHEAVLTLNMPAMKAYLTRKNSRSLASLPGVKKALAGANRPAALAYCDTPRLFDFCYPVISVYGVVASAGAQQAGIDLDPTYWPSAPAIRSHIRPDITTLERSPHGLQITWRYSLPTGGATGIYWFAVAASTSTNGFGLPGNLSSSWPFSPQLFRADPPPKPYPAEATPAPPPAADASNPYAANPYGASTGGYSYPASSYSPATSGYGAPANGYGAAASPYGYGAPSPAATSPAPAPATAAQSSAASERPSVRPNRRARHAWRARPLYR